MSIKVCICRFPFILILIAGPLLLKAQTKVGTLPINPSTHQIEYVENVPVPGSKQAKLYQKALNWVVGSKAYKFKKINIMDSSFGRIVAEGRFIFNNEEVFISLTVDVKDNKSQLKVSRFDYNMQVGNIPLDNLTNPKAKDVKVLVPLVANAMKFLIKDYRTAITKKP